jgi:hypothetical protein
MWIGQNFCCGKCRRTDEELISKEKLFDFTDKVTRKNSSFLQHISNSVKTDILVNVFFKDYQIALLPFIIIGENNKNHPKHIKSYEGLAALKILEETVPKSEKDDAFDELTTSWLKKNLKGHVKNEIMAHHGLFLNTLKSVFSGMLSKGTESGDK